MGGFGEGSDDRRAGEDVGVDDWCPLDDGERAGGVLKLNGVCGKGIVSFVFVSCCRLIILNILPISPNLRSSKTRNFLRRDSSFRPRMVLSLKSDMMSACVLRMQM